MLLERTFNFTLSNLENYYFVVVDTTSNNNIAKNAWKLVRSYSMEFVEQIDCSQSYNRITIHHQQEQRNCLGLADYLQCFDSVVVEPPDCLQYSLDWTRIIGALREKNGKKDRNILPIGVVVFVVVIFASGQNVSLFICSFDCAFN